LEQLTDFVDVVGLSLVQILLLLQSCKHFFQDAKVVHYFLFASYKADGFLGLPALSVYNNLRRFQLIVLSIDAP